MDTHQRKPVATSDRFDNANSHFEKVWIGLGSLTKRQRANFFSRTRDVESMLTPMGQVLTKELFSLFEDLLADPIEDFCPVRLTAAPKRKITKRGSRQ